MNAPKQSFLRRLLQAACAGPYSLKAVLAVVLGLVAAIPLHAQYPLVWSIDYIVADADQVLVGRYQKIGTVALDSKDGHQQPVAFAVEEILKGDRPLDLPFASWEGVYQGENRPAVVSDRQTDSHRLLVAVHHNAAAPARITFIDLDADGLAILRADLVILKTSAEVIQAAKDEVRRIPPGNKRIDAAELPAPGYDVKGAPFSGFVVIIPVDERLEERAHAILRGERDGQRSVAVDALKYFKSDENIRLLTGLLSDPDPSIRRYASHELMGWGIDGVKPAVER